MGWFDDDDDDDDDEEDKRPKFGSFAALKKDGDNDEEEEDPLDAYMKSLASNKEETRKPRSERLDVENEDEATSHWTTSESHDEPPPQPDEDPNEAALAMQSMFHKASNGQKQEHRQVNIQLQKVEHSSIGYVDFKKNILHGATSTQQGHDWRREHAISCHPPIDPIWQFEELRDVVPDVVLEWNSMTGIKQPTLVQSQSTYVRR